nr:MAG: hypothetical protein [Molluscum contagiosum virus]
MCRKMEPGSVDARLSLLFASPPSRSRTRSLRGSRLTMVDLRVETFSWQALLAAPRSSCEQPYSRTRDVCPARASARPHTKLTTTSLRSAE